MDKQETTFENKCSILSDLWLDYRRDSSLADFVDYNDIGLPLSFLVAEELVTPTERARGMVEETFTILLATMEIEDSGFESLDDIFSG